MVTQRSDRWVMTYTHVVLVVIDGLRPDAITPIVMPGLHQLGREFWRARTAITVRPSITVAALTSLATGVAPATHGLTQPRLGFLPGVRAARPLPRELERIGVETTVALGALSGSGRLVARTLLRLGGIRRLIAPEGRAGQVVGATLNQLDLGRPGLTVVYLDAVDRAGHRSGWMSGPYLEAAWEVDLALQPLFGVGADDSSLVIVTADHGGGGVEPSDHDAPHPDNDRVPLILAGGGVRRGTGLLPRASLLDIPPTILQAMGAPIPGCYEGRVLMEALGDPVGSVDLPPSEMSA
jgi:hypothetical protein